MLVSRECRTAWAGRLSEFACELNRDLFRDGRKSTIEFASKQLRVVVRPFCEIVFCTAVSGGAAPKLASGARFG